MAFHEEYNIRWYGPGRDSSESMPMGGHDIGCNVWMEGNSVYLYIQQSGWFDENNSMLKFGRLRLIFEEALIGRDSMQELVLEEGYIKIRIKDIRLILWTDVQYPVVHLEYKSEKKHRFTVHYESWRTRDRTVDRESFELFQCKEVFRCPDQDAVFHRDTILPSV